MCRVIQYSDPKSDLEQRKQQLKEGLLEFATKHVYHHTLENRADNGTKTFAQERHAKLQSDMADVVEKLSALNRKHMRSTHQQSDVSSTSGVQNNKAGKELEGNNDGAHRVDKKYIEVGRLYPPCDCFGEVSILDPFKGREPASVIADTYVELLVINKKQLNVVKQMRLFQKNNGRS